MIERERVFADRIPNHKELFTIGCNSTGSQCTMFVGDGRDLSFLKDDSIDAIITDHPYRLLAALKGGTRNFATYDLFQYVQRDFDEKFRVLKPGCFLVEFIPEESALNYEYLTRLKKMAMDAGFEYYSKIPWKKGTFISNTGRKSKNTEDIMIFSKGKARSIRPDAKKDKDEPGVKHYMSGAAGMLPTVFDFQPPSKKDRIHQAEKPVGLLEELIKFLTLDHECILDQFAGSGVAGEAALNLGRDCVLIEKDGVTASDVFSRMIDRFMPAC